MGAVYEAIDLRLETKVALKQAFSADVRLRKQFEQEARLLAHLHHPALPRVTDYFTEGDRVFLVMQFIAGEDLAEIIAKQPGPLPRNQVISWADELLDALIYLHTCDRQIVHRDIKPHNLKLMANGRIALLDFGLAKADSDSSEAGRSSSIFGFTRRYSPPEQMRDQGTSPRSDIYALGATLYHLLTGEKPPDALARAKSVDKSNHDPLMPANEIHPAVGFEIATILCKAMALNADHRFANANEFREALRRLGRNEVRAINNWSERTASEAGGLPSMNVTVVNKPAAVDPFDGYSILKPAEVNWLMPRPSRRPIVMAALLGLLLLGGAYAFSDVGEWTEFSKAASDYVKAGSARRNNGSESPQAKSEKTRVANLDTVSAVSADRRTRNPKRERPIRLAAKSGKQPSHINESPRAR
jgi:serine/threonine protein kinase